VHWRVRGNSQSFRKQNVPPFKGGTWQAFYAGGARCQHATKRAFLHCKKNAIRKIPVKVENFIATPKYRNMWTHGRGLLRQSHAIL
jgi:hypothetical protein